MELLPTPLILLVTGIIFGGFTSFVAIEKNRDGTGWFLLGFFFQLIALIAIVGVPRLPKKIRRSEEKREPGLDKKECENCSHFEATGVLDRFKGTCNLHNISAYKNHSCKDFSRLSEKT